MAAAKSTCVLQPDFCRKVVGRLLSCLALVGLLALQASIVWHAPEHALNASSRVTDAASSEDLVSSPSAAVASSSEQVPPSQELCLKCLEDVANTVGLTSQTVQLAASRTDVLQPRSQPVCLFATPVELANQRGPPTFLS
jgi:hypothetical protein